MTGSEKQEKFRVIAERRVNDVLNRIRLIGNLGNKNNYSYNPTQVKKIFEAIENEVREAKRKFEEKGKDGPGVFKLVD